MATAQSILKRAFSHSARVLQQQEHIIRPPVQVSGVEGKYASALYSSGVKEKNLDKLEKEMNQVKSIYDTNQDFKLFVENPMLNKQKKKDAVQAVLKSQGISQQTQNFCGVLAEGGRLNKLPAIVQSFDTIMRAHRNELQVEVASAEPLNKTQEQALNSALQKFATSGQKLNITFTVKPNLIGGLVLTVGDKYIDLSMFSRIKKIEDMLGKAI